MRGAEMLGRMAEDTSARFQAYLVERHDGEVYGEAIFATMAETSADAAQRYKIRVLEALERETKQVIARALEARGVRVEESAERWKQGEEFGHKLARVPWELFMKGFRPELARFVAEFESAEASAPLDDRALARHITDHERALLEFTDRELAGRAADSAEPVLAFLVNPPEPPAA